MSFANLLRVYLLAIIILALSFSFVSFFLHSPFLTYLIVGYLELASALKQSEAAAAVFSLLSLMVGKMI